MQLCSSLVRIIKERTGLEQAGGNSIEISNRDDVYLIIRSCIARRELGEGERIEG